MRRSITYAMLLTLAFSGYAQAHFAWLASDEDGHAIFFFGESIAETTYHMPEKLSSTEVHAWADGESQLVEMKAVDTDALIGKKSTSAPSNASMLTCSATYGIYQGSKLTYHCQHLTGKPGEWKQTANATLPIQAIIETTDEGGATVTVLLNNKPLADASVKLFCDKGHQEGDAKTDSAGQVQFSGKQVEDGLNGLLVAHVDKSSTGEFNGTEYAGEAHYLSVTFRK